MEGWSHRSIFRMATHNSGPTTITTMRGLKRLNRHAQSLIATGHPIVLAGALPPARPGLDRCAEGSVAGLDAPMPLKLPGQALGVRCRQARRPSAFEPVGAAGLLDAASTAWYADLKRTATTHRSGSSLRRADWARKHPWLSAFPVGFERKARGPVVHQTRLGVHARRTTSAIRDASSLG